MKSPGKTGSQREEKRSRGSSGGMINMFSLLVVEMEYTSSYFMLLAISTRRSMAL